MKAGQWVPDQQKAVINEIPIPEPADGQVLVKMVSASLCHSDLNPDFRPPHPVTLGHEGVGHIEKIHPSAENKGFKVGDAVGFVCFVGACYECYECHVNPLTCEKGQTGLQGVTHDGYFQPYVVADYRNCMVLPKELDMKKAAPLFCAGLTAYHAVESCELKQGDWFAVIGCGGVGQFAIQYAKAMGFKVIGLDISDDSLATAKTLGADAVFNSRTNKDYVSKLKKLAGGKGAHAAAVFSGADAAYKSAPDVLRINGLLMVIGIPPNSLQVSAMELVMGKYRIKADSVAGPMRMREPVEFAARHGIQAEVEFRTLDDLPQMVEGMHKGKYSCRQVVLF